MLSQPEEHVFAAAADDGFYLSAGINDDGGWEIDDAKLAACFPMRVEHDGALQRLPGHEAAHVADGLADVNGIEHCPAVGVLLDKCACPRELVHAWSAPTSPKDQHSRGLVFRCQVQHRSVQLGQL